MAMWLDDGFYFSGLRKLLEGVLVWDDAVMDWSAALVDDSAADPDYVNDSYLVDISTVLATAPMSNLIKSSLNTYYDISLGTGYDADDTVFSTPPASTYFESVIIFQDTGDPATSMLLYRYQNGSGFQRTLDGTPLTVVWPIDRLFVI